MAGFAEEFAEITKCNESLTPFTFLKVGGPAEFLVQPRTREQLAGVVRRCFRERVPVRVLGTGCNLLVRDEGVTGVVLRLVEPEFTSIIVEGKRVRAGTGAAVSALISESARHGLAGLETLVGIPGTVGGALRTNAGDRAGDIGQFVRAVEVLDANGDMQVRERDELRFADRASNLDDPVLLAVEFALEPAALIEQAGLAKTRVGGAEVSDRDANYIVVHPGASARDVLRLIDLMRSRVQERFNVELERDITIW